MQDGDELIAFREVDGTGRVIISFMARAGRVADSFLAEKLHDIIGDEARELMRYIQQKTVKDDPERKVFNVLVQLMCLLNVKLHHARVVRRP